MTKTKATEFLWESEVYGVKLGSVYMEDRERAVEGYHVLNKETKVIEAERNTLPEALIVAKRLQQMLDAFAEESEADALAVEGLPGELPMNLNTDPTAKKPN